MIQEPEERETEEFCSLKKGEGSDMGREVIGSWNSEMKKNKNL